eukprot:34439_1
MPGAIGGLDPKKEITFAKILKTKNYNTKILGKWHVGSRKEFLPFNHGFDEFIGIPDSTNQGLSPWDPYGYINVLPLIDNDTIIQQPPDLSTLNYKLTNESIIFINKSINNNKPFLLYMSYLHAHVPDFTSVKSCNSSLRGRYGDSINDLDVSFGTIMSFINNSKEINNTVIFFTSDNGPWLNKSIAAGSASLFFEGKWTNWEGGIRMPAFVYWNGKIKKHSISYEMVSTIDIFPTIISLSGAQIPMDRYIDGKDITQLLLSENDNDLQQPIHECLYFYGGSTNSGCNKYLQCPGLWAIRCGSYKMHWVTRHTNWTYDQYGIVTDSIRGPIIRNPPLLYNIDQDPSEKFQIDSNSDLYRNILEYMTMKRNDMEDTVDYETITNQVELGTSDEYIWCCNEFSETVYPQYPVCTCTPDNWEQFVCEPICLGLGSCIV